jgi:peptidoglycan/LPS O-acetylase OafA/YrhL
LNLLCTAAIGGTLFLGTGPWSSLVQPRILRFFGEISYGLYLLHMLIFNIFDNIEHDFFPHIPSFKNHFGVTVVRFLICGSLSIGSAYLSRRYFEDPFLRLRDQSPSPPADALREATAA